MFLIQDGREHFYQWDTARKLIVEDSSITEVHFCNKTEECSLVVKTYVEDGRTVADVPNILLQTDWRINVYAFDKNYTKHCAVFKVMARSKPDTYVYTETELLNYADLNEKITQMEQNIGQVVEDYLKENPIEMPETDLSDYYNKDDIDAALAEKEDKHFVITVDGDKLADKSYSEFHEARNTGIRTSLYYDGYFYEYGGEGYDFARFLRIAENELHFVDLPDWNNTVSVGSTPIVDMSNYYTIYETDKAIDEALAEFEVPEGTGAKIGRGDVICLDITETQN